MAALPARQGATTADSPPSPAFSDDESENSDVSESNAGWWTAHALKQREKGGYRGPRRRFLSFATDLVSSYDLVKKRSATSVKICDEVVHLLRMRVSVEEAYAKGLEKCANHDFPADDGETAKEALEALRTDLLNKAVQHRELTVHLQDDVLEPFGRLRAQMSGKHKSLLARMTRLQKDSKSAEDRYRRSHARYTKAFRDAAGAVVAVLEIGAPPPKLDPAALMEPTAEDTLTFSPSASEHGQRGGGSAWGGDAASIDGGGGSTAGSVASSITATDAKSGRRRYMSAISDKVRDAMPHPNKDIVQWLLPTDKQRRDGLVEAAQAALQDAERARRKCRTAWFCLSDVLCGGVRELQHVLTDFQGMEERLVADLQDGLRKAVVFDSSALANQQYDSQKLFKVLESISGEVDLRRFIAGAAASDAAAGAAFGGSSSGLGGAATAGEAGRMEGSVSVAILHRVFMLGADLPPPPPDEMISTPLTTAAVAPVMPEAFAALLQLLPVVSTADVAACLGSGRGDGEALSRGGSSATPSADVSPSVTPKPAGDAGGFKAGGGNGGGSSAGGMSPPYSPVIAPADRMLEVLSVHAAPGRLGFGALASVPADDSATAASGTSNQASPRDDSAIEDGRAISPASLGGELAAAVAGATASSELS